MELNESLQKQLQEALFDAFTTQDALVQLAVELKADSIIFAPEASPREIILQLMKWADAPDKLSALLASALQARPDNRQLHIVTGAISTAGGAVSVGGNVYDHRVTNIYPSGTELHASESSITWGEFQKACRELTQRKIDQIETEREHVFAPRIDAQQCMHNFLESTCTFLVIIGESGMGKSSLLWEMIRQLENEPNIAVLVLSAINLEANISLVDTVDDLLRHHTNRRDPSVLQTIERYSLESEQKLLIVVDALNENCAPYELIKRINEVRSIYNFPWIKIILTCRPHVWHQARRGYKEVQINRRDYYQPSGSNHNFVELGRFTTEEAKDAYRRYKQTFNFIGPDFEDLPPPLRTRLRDPLLLRLLAEIYKEDRFPQSVSSLDIDIVPRYMAYLERQDRLDDSDEAFLTEHFNRHLISREECNGTIERDRLVAIGDPDLAKVHLKHLLDAGILIEATANESVEAKPVLRFRYERFQDYYLGRLLYENLLPERME